MKIRLNVKDRRALLDAGYQRQTLRKWIVVGVTPHQSTRHYVMQIIGRDPWDKKRRKAA